MQDDDQAALAAALAELQRVRDYLEHAGRTVLQTAPEVLTSGQQASLRVGMRKIFEPFQRVIDKRGTIAAKEAAELFGSVAELLQGAFLIGAFATRNVAAENVLHAAQAANARQKNIEVASERKKKLRPAIMEAAAQQGVELVGSIKFAESIGDRVRSIARVESDARGFSDTTIQREISSILKERRSSQFRS